MKRLKTKKSIEEEVFFYVGLSLCVLSCCHLPGALFEEAARAARESGSEKIGDQRGCLGSGPRARFGLGPFSDPIRRSELWT